MTHNDNLLLDPGLLASPIWYPEHIERPAQAIQFCRMTEHSYRTSSFLDHRIVRASPEERSLAFSDLAQIDGPAGYSTCYVFHGAFCCSTLLTRLLDNVAGSLVLREPHSLFELASFIRFQNTSLLPVIPDDVLDQIYRVLVALYARRLRIDVPVVIKPSDGCNNLMTRIVADESCQAAVFLYADLERFLVSVLKYPERHEWARVRARELCMDKRHRTGKVEIDPQPLSDGQAAALVWVLHMDVCREAASGPGGEKLRTLDSETLMTDMGKAFEAVISHFDLPNDPATIAKAVSIERTGSHSKSPQESYDRITRQRDFDEARARFAGDVEATLDWVRSTFNPLRLDVSGLRPLLP
jgi:hypothetical protein